MGQVLLAAQIGWQLCIPAARVERRLAMELLLACKLLLSMSCAAGAAAMQWFGQLPWVRQA
jgi:hypothetical protein